MAQFTVAAGASGNDALLTLITNKASPARPASHFTAGAPEVLSGDSSFNTRVLVTPTAAANLQGQMYFRYNRVPLAKMLSNNPNLIDTTTATSVSGLLANLNSASGLTLTMDDLVDQTFASGTTTVTLTAKSTSRFFIPGTTLAVGYQNVDGPAWFLYDTGNLAVVTGTTPASVVSTNTTQDTAYKIDNRNTRAIPANSTVTINLGEVFDMTAAEWTVEWSTRYDGAATTYANLFQLTTGTALPGFVQRQSDNGFGARIHQGVMASAVSDLYGLPFNTTQKNGVLVRYALVKYKNLLTIFVEGVPTMLANGTSGTYNQKGIPTTASSPPSTTNRVTFGGQSVPIHVGALRISKFARYFTQYTPAPF